MSTPVGVQEVLQIVLAETLMKGEFTNAVRMKLEGQVLGRGCRLVHHFSLIVESGALHEELQDVVGRELKNQKAVKLLKEFLRDRIIGTIGARGFERLIEERQELLDRLQLRRLGGPSR